MKITVAVGAMIFASVSMFASGADLYRSCGGCHGAKAEKPALGASKIISKMSKSEIAAALKGYKAGTYGAAKKGIMKGQADRLNDAQIDELATFIPTLK
jgi:cytochrome c553